jgi:LuxR family maltose regulon positive regulatory protein
VFFCLIILDTFRGTVKWYSSEIYGKLGVANRTQAVAEARRLKLFE